MTPTPGNSITLYLYIDTDLPFTSNNSSQLLTGFNFSRYEYDAVKRPIATSIRSTRSEFSDTKEQIVHQQQNRIEEQSKPFSRNAIYERSCMLSSQSKFPHLSLVIPYLGAEVKIRLIACFSIYVTMRLMLYLIRITHTISRLISSPLFSK